jgi:hypothetical protein
MNYETNSLWGTGYYSGKNQYMSFRSGGGFGALGPGKKRKARKKKKKRWRSFGQKH